MTTTTRRSGWWLAAAAVAWLVLMSQPEESVAWPVWTWAISNAITDVKVDFMCYKEMYNRIGKLNAPETSGLRKFATALDACGFRRYTGGWWPLGFLEEDVRT